ncbi:MAG: FAD-binding protein [Clostridia bacterium]|nr:FAD-binding protein [Clostridia bacterium]
MPKLIFNENKIDNMESFLKICPFGALSCENGRVVASAACKMCKLCVKNGPEGAAVFSEEEKISVDKSLWSGIAVYADHENGKIHPVTYELIGKARELASKTGQKVYCLIIGDNIEAAAEELRHYNADEIYVYDRPELKNYLSDIYTAVFEDFINSVKPCAVLVGATAEGRELAPRVAARFRTGLTADCTILDMDKNTDLIQIRPAFGGNIMAQIITPNNRPQLATVRYKVMNAPERQETASGRIINCSIKQEQLLTKTKLLTSQPKASVKTIENAEIIVAAGRGVKSKDDIEMLRSFAELLGGELACTRPLVEAGWFDARHQIGLSGRTVRPKLIIACGISGAVQFTAGMNNSDCIIAINKDEKAPIFKTANFCVIGDIYDILPKMIQKLKNSERS